MPRRSAAVRREDHSDAVYNNRFVTQLINKSCSTARVRRRASSTAFDIVAAKTGRTIPERLQRGHGQRPPHPLRSSPRVGGATYQVPIEVNSRRATTLAIRWIVDFSRNRKEHTMAQAPCC